MSRLCLRGHEGAMHKLPTLYRRSRDGLNARHEQKVAA
jgi:hypothetical protein